MIAWNSRIRPTTVDLRMKILRKQISITMASLERTKLVHEPRSRSREHGKREQGLLNIIQK
jgi:hypothetical protein